MAKIPHLGITAIPLFRDLGVSALLAIMTTASALFITISLGLHGQVDDALKLAGPLFLLAERFVEAYQTKRREDKAREEREHIANGSLPLTRGEPVEPPPTPSTPPAQPSGSNP